MTTASYQRLHRLALGVSTAVAVIIGWPLLVHAQNLAVGVAAFVLTWLWIASFIYLSAASWPYHHAWAVASLALSFAAPVVAGFAVGASTSNVIVGSAIVGILASSVIAYIWKRG